MKSIREMLHRGFASLTHRRSIPFARERCAAKQLPLIGALAAVALICTALVVPHVEAAGTWSLTDSMSTARWYHAAALLPDGRVLVAGGHNGGSVETSAAIYNPATGIWSLTGSMNTARYFHTMTLLANGRVLVTGGSDGSSPAASAEIYDPATSMWSLTDSMSTGRNQHTATLLADGRVLVTGGDNGSSKDASAEIYDPATGTWSLTDSMSAARYVHTATRLSDGRVLVTGGGDVPVLASAEIYDPATGTWSLTDPMNTARYVHTATLLSDGQVLVTGGDNFSSFLFLDSAEIYDPATGAWSVASSMSTARYAHRATLLPDGGVLVIGGNSDRSFGAGTYPAGAEIYDPATNTWASAGSMSTGRNAATATLLPDARVLVAGGSNSAGFLASAEIFDSGPPQGSLLTALGPARVWVGLKNSDDVGIRFDLRAEVYRDATLVGSGVSASVVGGSSGFNNAKLDAIPMTPDDGVTFSPGDTLKIKLLIRNACVGSGKNSGSARLWFNDSVANSRFDATIGSAATYYLLNGSALSTAAGAGPKNTIDVAAGAKCSAYKVFGTWSVTLP